MPERPRPPEYGDDVAVRWVTNQGYASWKGKPLYLTKLLCNQPIGFRQVDEDEWELFYGPILLADVLIRDGKPVIKRAA